MPHSRFCPVVWPAILVVTVGNIVQASVFLNHDVAWVLYSSGRLLDGAVFGQGIIAANPPLIWWISAIPEAFARLLGIDPILAFRVMVFGISLIVLLDVHKILVKQFPPLQTGVILVVFGAMISFGVHRDFGQREHLAVLLCLPYLMRAANLLESDAPLSKSHWVASIAAGVGVAFKPHFVLVPILVELFLSLRRRSFMHLIRPDVLIGTATVVIYLVTVFIWARPYISNVVPAISEVYWGFSSSPMRVVEKSILDVLFLCLILLLIIINKFSSFATVMALAALGFFIAALMQAKGYTYHLYPTTIFILLSLVCITNSQFKILALVSTMSASALLYLEAQNTQTYLFMRSANGIIGQRIQSVVDTIREHVPEGGQFFAISTHPFPGFPVANYAKRDWAAASNSRIFLPAIIRLRASGKTTKNSSLLKVAEQRERAAMMQDLKDLPTLILIDVAPRRHAIGTLDFDFLSFYSEESTFRAIWENYEEIDAGIELYRAFKLKKERML